MGAHRIRIPETVEAFFRQHRTGRRRLLALTYEFDANAFERAFSFVLGQSIQVDVVAGRPSGGSAAGARYWRARWPGTFHPKVLCLLANAHVSVGLGSANLTFSGLGENLEVWSFFEGPEDRAVLAGVRDLLERLQTKGVFPRAASVEEVVEALPAAEDAHPLVSTLHGRLVDQVASRVEAPDEVDLITPINSDPTRVVTQLRRTVGGGEYRLFTGVEPIPRIRGIDRCFALERPTLEDPDGPRAVGLAHAKMFAFRKRSRVELFWGSANLSYSAWLARGARANADILVHCSLSASAWHRLRDRWLPPGHGWREVQPAGPPPEGELEHKGASLELLHCCVESDAVTIDATRSGSATVHLRTPRARATCPLVFREGQATLPATAARRLGFDGGSSPRTLEWFSPSIRTWLAIPVNELAGPSAVGAEVDLVGQLFWEFSGRPMPGRDALQRTSSATADASDEYNSPDEEELTASQHQGALDRFVLEWRAVAARISHACGVNDGLRRFYSTRVLTRVEEEAKHTPERWSESRLAFVRQLLERQWLE